MRRELRSQGTSVSDDPRRCRQVAARDASAVAVVTALGMSCVGCVCPRHERLRRSRPSEARSVAVATTFRGASIDGCVDCLWWHPKTTISSDATHRWAFSSDDHLRPDGLWSVLWSGTLGIVLRQRTIWSMFISIDDYVLCLLLTLFMYFSDDFYNDDYDFYVCHKIVPNSRGDF
jgi:hypothetical protein